VADLNNREDVSRIEDLLRSNSGITTLVNNAGVGAAAPLLQSDIGKMDDMITLNVTALTRLTSSGIGAVYADMTENVYWVFEVAVNPGRFEDLKTLMAAQVEVTQRNEVGALNYEWEISDDQKVCHI